MSVVVIYDKKIISPIPISGTYTRNCAKKQMKTNVQVIESDDISTPNVTYSLLSDGTYQCNGGTVDLDTMPIKTLYNDKLVTRINTRAFYNGEFSKVIFPQKLTTILDSAFNGCVNLKEIILPKTLNHIGSYAFNNCGFTSITISKTITSINDGAFANCANLNFVTIENGLTVIKNSTFKGCYRLLSVNLPSSITEIQNSAFENCLNLAKIDFAGTKAQWNAITKGSSWNNNAGILYIVCTDGDINLQ